MIVLDSLDVVRHIATGLRVINHAVYDSLHAFSTNFDVLSQTYEKQLKGAGCAVLIFFFKYALFPNNRQ